MQTHLLVKGIGLGIVAGVLVTTAIMPVDRKRFARSKTGQAVKTIGRVVESVSEALM